MKRLMVILLLISISYSFLGAGFIYNVWLYSIKKEVKEKLEHDLPEESVIIKVQASWENHPPEQFQWHEEHEFRYRGQMYDIIRKEQHGDQMWYYCHWDKAETELLNNLSEYLASHLQRHPDQQQTKTFIKIVIDNIFLLSHAGAGFDLPFNTTRVDLQQWGYGQNFPDIDPPPPRLY